MAGSFSRTYRAYNKTHYDHYFYYHPSLRAVNTENRRLQRIRAYSLPESKGNSRLHERRSTVNFDGEAEGNCVTQGSRADVKPCRFDTARRKVNISGEDLRTALPGSPRRAAEFPGGDSAVHQTHSTAIRRSIDGSILP